MAAIRTSCLSPLTDVVVSFSCPAGVRCGSVRSSIPASAMCRGGERQARYSTASSTRPCPLPVCRVGLLRRTCALAPFLLPFGLLSVHLLSLFRFTPWRIALDELALSPFAFSAGLRWPCCLSFAPPLLPHASVSPCYLVVHVIVISLART